MRCRQTSARFGETIAVRPTRARSEIMRGNVDPKQFDDRNIGLTPEQIYDRLETTVPASHARCGARRRHFC
jgi:aminoglycoside phosphotransferase